MAGQTKLIIVTSNEDLIRQITFNKSLNTHIIDLDNNQQSSSLLTTGNDMNMTILDKLFESNSNNDLLYKDALDLPRPKKPKTNQIRKKSIDLVCVICGDRAIGYNYDALSCNSCKAFFRRNAHQPTAKIRCVTGQGQCSVGNEVRRKCTRCRLNKCLAMGMRRDFVMSEEQKQERRKKMEENQTMTMNSSSNPDQQTETLDEIDQLLMNINESDENLLFNASDNMLIDIFSIDDWLTIQNIQSSFTFYMCLPTVRCIDVFDFTNLTSALITWSQFADGIGLRYINFFRHLDEFENLHVDDRLILIKYNMFSLYPFCKCYNYKSTNDCCATEECEERIKHRYFFQLCGAPSDMHQSFIDIVVSLVHITDQDPIFISLLLIVLLFSQGLSMSDEEPLLKDPLAVYQIQFRYTTILWNYMVNKQGEAIAQKQFVQLIQVIFQSQSMIKEMREVLRNQLMISDIVDQITPLMQTVLHVS
ncbi:hypothetical protein I4U23_012303 [Adineta vaga]|nr:hypothetical protein I4U23_012303 [Adineta vaga]